MNSRATPFLVTLLATLGALAGCAIQYTPGAFPPDHPANPDAAETPAAPASMTLAVNDPVRPALAGGMQKMGPGSGGMQHGSSSMNQGTSGSESGPPVASSGGHEGHSLMAAPTAAAQTPATEPAASRAMYVCPMHPKVLSTNPKDNCPECNMKINKPVRQAAGPSTAPAAPARAGNATPGDKHGGH